MGSGGTGCGSDQLDARVGRAGFSPRGGPVISC